MKLYTGQRWALIGGDCRERVARFAEHRFDAVVTDPPYELGFMGKAWDSSGVAFQAETWAAMLRVLKPGGHLVAFGGSRTFHRIAVAIEDAGFEMRDTLCWLYGTGFPKSLNVSAAIDKARQDDPRPVCRFLRAAMDARGFSSAYIAGLFAFHPRMVDHWAARDSDSQPAVPTLEQWEKLRSKIGFGPEMDAEVYRLNERKGTLGDAWLARPVIGQHGKNSPGNSMRVGMLGEGEDPAGSITAPATDAARRWGGWGTALKPGWEPIILARKPLDGTVAENVQRWGTGALNVDGCRIETTENLNGGAYASQGTTRDDGWGMERGGAGKYVQPAGRWPPNVCLDEDAAVLLDEQSGILKSGAKKAAELPNGLNAVYGRGMGGMSGSTASTGGASRFFYCAKASRTERDAGCESLPERSGGQATDREDESAGLSSPRAGAGRGGGARNHHPTVKPVALMRWLVRLVTPPGGAVLDPFSGSGSTGVAVLEEEFSFCGVEQDPEYLEIARCRLERAARERGAA